MGAREDGGEPRRSRSLASDDRGHFQQQLNISGVNAEISLDNLVHSLPVETQAMSYGRGPTAEAPPVIEVQVADTPGAATAAAAVHQSSGPCPTALFGSGVKPRAPPLCVRVDASDDSPAAASPVICESPSSAGGKECDSTAAAR